MLIVAMPKTASTSLMLTMGKMFGVPARQDWGKDYPNTEIKSYTHLAHLHSDIRDWPPRVVTQWGTRKFIRKQHLLPTPTHLAAIDPLVVFLWRKPDEIIEAYLRNSAHDTAYVKEHSSELLQELYDFLDGYTYHAPKLAISFDHLVESPRDVIEMVANHWSFDTSRIPSRISLELARYSGHTPPATQG